MLIGAHHDDNELMSGTIAQHRQAGWRVVSVVMTNGRWVRGDMDDKHIEIRNNESRDAAKLLDIEPVFLGFGEGVIRETEATCRGVITVIRKYRPTVVITHPPHDYHADHMATSRSVFDAMYRCDSVAYDCDEPPCPGPQLYYSDAWAMPFQPDVYVDVSAHVDLKRQALALHVSQITPQGPQHGDMIDVEMTRARQRGIEAGVEYAEAYQFVPRPGHVRMANVLT
jgi:LmbE family N-acetylglucosaminyl deacetylase